MITCQHSDDSPEDPDSTQRDPEDLVYSLISHESELRGFVPWLYRVQSDLRALATAPLDERTAWIVELVLGMLDSRMRLANEVAQTLVLVEQIDPEGLDAALRIIGAAGYNLTARSPGGQHEPLDKIAAVVRMAVLRSMTSRSPASLAMLDTAMVSWRRARQIQAETRGAHPEELVRLVSAEAAANRHFLEAVRLLCAAGNR